LTASDLATEAGVGAAGVVVAAGADGAACQILKADHYEIPVWRILI